MQGPVDIVGSGDLTLSGSNNLNIASGVLKMGGLSTLQIVGVHLFRHDWNRNTWYTYVTVGWVSDTTSYTVSGHRLVVTPSSANSRFFFTGSLRYWASGSSDRNGIMVRLHEGNTSAVGSVSNGQIVTGPSDHGGYDTDKDVAPYLTSTIDPTIAATVGDHGEHSHANGAVYMVLPYTFLTPTVGSTDPKVYDMVFRMSHNAGAGEVVGYYGTQDQSTMYAIEYIDPS